MGEVSTDELRKAVESMHGCKATLIGPESVTEMMDGQVVWEGVVYAFRLSGHDKASFCYAWSSPVEGTPRRKFYAVLELPPLKTAADAVRASIVSDFRKGGSA